MGGASVRQVKPNERPRAVAVQVTAFCEDPVVRWCLPDPLAYVEDFPRYLEAFMAPSFEYGTVDVAGDFEGVAYWVPAGADVDFAAISEVSREVTVARHRDDLLALWEQMEKYHPATPHWYLAKIAVDPICQRRGAGSSLVAQRLRLCDGGGLAVYVESSNPANLSFYERHGFEVLGEIQAGSSPPLFPMLRRPR
jgi:ribosomal protein S18 acetylase RimI-like enzyme